MTGIDMSVVSGMRSQNSICTVEMAINSQTQKEHHFLYTHRSLPVPCPNFSPKLEIFAKSTGRDS